MIKKLLSIALLLYFALISQQVGACANHMYLNPDSFGMLKGAAIRLAGLAAPEPVFKIKHPPVAKVMLGEKSEITIEYDRPWRSDNVRMQLTSTSGIKLMDKSIALDDYDGTVKVRYILEKPGFNKITIRLMGEFKGESVVSAREVYIQPKKMLLKSVTAESRDSMASAD
jgi:hypothetical protein